MVKHYNELEEMINKLEKAINKHEEIVLKKRLLLAELKRNNESNSNN